MHSFLYCTILWCQQSMLEVQKSRHTNTKPSAFLMEKHFRSRVTPSAFHMQNETVSNKQHNFAPLYSLSFTSLLFVSHLHLKKNRCKLPAYYQHCEIKERRIRKIMENFSPDKHCIRWYEPHNSHKHLGIVPHPVYQALWNTSALFTK